jgi:hypothetical protein
MPARRPGPPPAKLGTLPPAIAESLAKLAAGRTAGPAQRGQETVEAGPADRNARERK